MRPVDVRPLYLLARPIVGGLLKWTFVCSHQPPSPSSSTLLTGLSSSAWSLPPLTPSVSRPLCSGFGCSPGLLSSCLAVERRRLPLAGDWRPSSSSDRPSIHSDGLFSAGAKRAGRRPTETSRRPVLD
ncbi:unnamed protein product [Protopolystoma xenopodis]|uniref:Uncharacterized protein n=1 Tax=Protopolystoma xenopodis TaxID=117903 RepID=A0A3S5ABA8_9PLAT|nr:unnamed protein product [Protopolystoma xenopodis]